MTPHLSRVLLACATASVLSMLAVSTAFTPPQAAEATAQAALPFVSVQPDLLGMPHSLSNAWGDYDNDGGLDLTLTDGYTDVGGHFVFRNTLPDEAKKRSLSVTVLNAKGHFTTFGAEVRLRDGSGKVLATRQVPSASGYNTQRAAPVHFGLATAGPVTVEVTFMGKDGRKTQTLANVNPADYSGKSLVVRQED